MAYTDINRYLNQIKKEKDEKVKAENIKRDVEMFGVTGTYDGIVDLSKADATPDDVISPKLFYNKDGIQEGQIKPQIDKITGGMNCYKDETNLNYWVADVNDKYGIAVVYVYNQQNPWYIYEWKGNTLGKILQSLSAGTYPNGTLTKSISISREVNSQGYLNIWCHAVNSSHWSDDMQGYWGVIQYDYTQNRIITNKTITTSKPGGYTDSWNEDGNMAVCPTDASRCFVTYHNTNTIYHQLLIYNNVTNTIDRVSTNFDNNCGPSYQCEWDETGTYILIDRGGKSHPNDYCIIKLNPNNTLSTIYKETNTQPNTIYKHYIIIGNRLYNIESGSKVLIATWDKYYKNLTNGQGIMWTYQDYLFVVDYGLAKFYCFHINTDFSLSALFTRKCANYVSDSRVQYTGTLLMPSSNTFLYYMPAKNLVYKFEIAEQTDKIVSLEVQGEKFANIGGTTATNTDVLSGKVFFDKDGQSIGTMSDNGYTVITPNGTTQTIKEGYYSGGIVEAVSSNADINIVGENIRKGVNILGVEGTFEGATGGDATSDGNIQAKYLLEGYSVVSDGKLIEGTMKNYGMKDMRYQEQDQEIPCGYYDELYISSVSSSDLTGYTECLTALQNI